MSTSGFAQLGKYTKPIGTTRIPLFFDGDSLVYLSSANPIKDEVVGSYENISTNYYLMKVGSTKPYSDIKNMFVAKASGVDDAYIVSVQSDEYMKNHYGLSNLYITHDLKEIDKSKRILDSYKSNTMMPALSASGNILFFVSDRQGGKGGLDLWYSLKDEYGYWGRPKNLEILNTPGDEITPHCGIDGRFYYSSNWKEGEKKDFDIFQSGYKRLGNILKPIKGKRLLENLNNDTYDEIAPVLDPNGKVLHYASTGKAGTRGAFDLFSTNIYGGKPNLYINPTSGSKVYWVKDTKNVKYYEVIPGIDIYLEKGNDYRVYLPNYICEECEDKLVQELIITNLDDSLFNQQMPIENRKKSNDTYVLKNNNRNQLFIQGYWKPFTRKSYRDFKKWAKEGRFNSTSFIDSSLYDYGTKVEMSEQIWANTVQEIADVLKKSKPYCRKSECLVLNVSVSTNDIKIQDYKAPYAKNNEKIYSGKTITQSIPNMEVIPSGIKITDKSWKFEGEKYRLAMKKQGGNYLLSSIRANFTGQLLDSLLKQYSPVYSNLKAHDKVIITVEGLGYDENVPEEKIEINLNRYRISNPKPELSKQSNRENSIEIKALPKITAISKTMAGENVSSVHDLKKIKAEPIKLNINGKLDKNIIKQRFSAPKIYSKYRAVSITQASKKEEQFYYFIVTKCENYEDAKKDLKILNSRNAKGCEIIIKSNLFGEKEYMIYSPLFKNENEYKAFKKRFRTVLKQVGSGSTFKLLKR
jgi:hypothetical protein